MTFVAARPGQTPGGRQAQIVPGESLKAPTKLSLILDTETGNQESGEKIMCTRRAFCEIFFNRAHFNLTFLIIFYLTKSVIKTDLNN